VGHYCSVKQNFAWGTKHSRIVSNVMNSLQSLPERVNFKLALMAHERQFKVDPFWHMAYRVLNGLAPPYPNQLVPVSSLPGRRRLWSSFTLQLHIPQYRLSTAGCRSFPVAASIFWNTLPDDVQSVCSFRRQLQDIPISLVISGHHTCSLNFRTTLSWTLQQFRLF